MPPAGARARTALLQRHDQANDFIRDVGAVLADEAGNSLFQDLPLCLLESCSNSKTPLDLLEAVLRELPSGEPDCLCLSRILTFHVLLRSIPQ